MKNDLIAARALIEKGWIKGTLARSSKNNQSVDVNSPKADMFCAVGALCRATGYDEIGILDPIYRAVVKAIGDVKHISPWNDDPKTTKEEVLAAFDRAIASCDQGKDAQR